jgi:cytochrome P450
MKKKKRLNPRSISRTKLQRYANAFFRRLVMTNKTDDWNPRADSVLGAPLAAFDNMRKHCPVAYSEYLQWSLFRHEDIMRVLEDHDTFSSAVSTHISVPNTMDPPEHSHYRRIIESYFSAARMDAFEPVCRQLAAELVQQMPRDKPIECISQFAQTFALQVQCNFLGWPNDKLSDLQSWMDKNQAAILAADRTAMGEVALEFSLMVADIIAARRKNNGVDIIGSLTQENVNGRPLKDEEIISILRNWTGGEIGTIAASLGIIIYFLTQHPTLQQELREHPEKIPEALDEILRIHGPLITNRRVTTCPVTLGDRQLEAGERLTLFWVSANRDENIFDDPQQFKWGRDPEKNLLYGAGIHVCPGAPLARLELRVIIEELLRSTKLLEIAQTNPPSHARYPAGGYTELYIQLS